MENIIGLLTLLMMLHVVLISHELGHFIPALLFKFKVKAFRIGIFPAFTIFRYRGIPIKYNPIAFMGGVQFDQEDYPTRPAGQRLIMTLAGPMANLILFIIPVMIVAIFFGQVPAGIEYLRQMTAGFFQILSHLPDLLLPQEGQNFQTISVSYAALIARYGFSGMILQTLKVGYWIGLLNLLPFPGLDGSHIIFQLIELLGGGNRIQRLGLIVNSIGMLVLFIYTLYVFVSLL